MDLPTYTLVNVMSSSLSYDRWENPLMGWTSTGDPYANVGDSALSFDSELAAKSFAQRHGWDYVVLRLPCFLLCYNLYIIFTLLCECSKFIFDS